MNFANLSNKMASESCSLDIDPEKTMTMIEDVLDYSDSVDNEQLVSIKEMFYIHLDAPSKYKWISGLCIRKSCQ